MKLIELKDLEKVDNIQPNDEKKETNGTDPNGREVSKLPVEVKPSMAKFLANLFTGNLFHSVHGKSYAEERAFKKEINRGLDNYDGNFGTNKIVRLKSEFIPNNESKEPSVLSRIGSAVNDFFKKDGTLHNALRASPRKSTSKMLEGKPISEMLEEIRTKKSVSPAQVLFEALSKKGTMEGKTFDVQGGKLVIVEQGFVTNDKSEQINSFLFNYSKFANLQGFNNREKKTIGSNLRAYFGFNEIPEKLINTLHPKLFPDN